MNCREMENCDGERWCCGEEELQSTMTLMKPSKRNYPSAYENENITAGRQVPIDECSSIPKILPSLNSDETALVRSKDVS